jgi:Flp pilus assembly protein TadG
MKMSVLQIAIFFAGWLRDRSGAVAAEFAMILPVMVALLFGVYDLGTAIVINQKAIASSQIMADLVSRSVAVTQDELDDIVFAGREAMRPYTTADFSYSVVSVEFAADPDDPEPSVCWDEGPVATTNAMLEGTEPLAAPGEGIVVVTVQYQYEPVFATYLMDTLNMSEVAFARGRRTPVVAFQDGVQIGCDGDF